MRLNQKGLIDILIAGLILFAIIAGSVIYIRSQSSDSSSDGQNTDSEAITNSESATSENISYPQTPSVSTDVRANTETLRFEKWIKYEGDGYSFEYPETWLSQKNQPDDWQFATEAIAEGHELKEGRVVDIKFDSQKKQWIITRVNSNVDEVKVGDVHNISRKTSGYGVTVYDTGYEIDSYQYLIFLFEVGDKMVTIHFPRICLDESCAAVSDPPDPFSSVRISGEVAKSIRVVE